MNRIVGGDDGMPLGPAKTTLDTDQRRLVAACLRKSVVYMNGNVNGMTCAMGCNGECCVRNQPCDQFTGTVWANKNSCMGISTCNYATIKMVTVGCNGTKACSSAVYGAASKALRDLVMARGCATTPPFVVTSQASSTPAMVQRRDTTPPTMAATSRVSRGHATGRRRSTRPHTRAISAPSRTPLTARGRA